MAFINSSNMQLPIPTVGSEQGPAYAYDINSCLTLIDGHDHSPGRGVQITPAGININTALNFNNNTAAGLIGVTLNADSSASSIPQTISVAPGSTENDLWYTDSNGVKVQITDAGQLAAVPTSVAGLSYSLGTFSFRQTPDGLPTKPATLDAGAVIIRPNVAATTFGVKLTNNAGIASQYNLIFPAALPGSASFATIDGSGNIGVSTPLLGALTTSNLSSSAGILGSQIATGTIIDANITPGTLTTTSIASATILGSNIAATTITESNLAASTDWNSSTISGTLTNTNVTTTITGFQPTHSRPISYRFAGYLTTNTSGGTATITIAITEGLTGTTVSSFVVPSDLNTTRIFPMSMFNFTHSASNVGSTHNAVLTITASGATVTYTSVEMFITQ